MCNNIIDFFHDVYYFVTIEPNSVYMIIIIIDATENQTSDNFLWVFIWNQQLMFVKCLKLCVCACVYLINSFIDCFLIESIIL
jgi:hypothetical protein